jgi:hypothetical protein
MGRGCLATRWGGAAYIRKGIVEVIVNSSITLRLETASERKSIATHSSPNSVALMLGLIVSSPVNLATSPPLVELIITLFRNVLSRPSCEKKKPVLSPAFTNALFITFHPEPHSSMYTK